MRDDSVNPVPEWAWQPYTPTSQELAHQLWPLLNRESGTPVLFQRLDGVAPQTEVRQMADDLQKMRHFARLQWHDPTYWQSKGAPGDFVHEVLDGRLRAMQSRLGEIEQIPDAKPVVGIISCAKWNVWAAHGALHRRDQFDFDKFADRAAGHLTLTVPDRGPDPAPDLWRLNQVSAAKVLLSEIDDRLSDGMEIRIPLRQVQELLAGLERARDRGGPEHER